jgi:hypothetical protein
MPLSMMIPNPKKSQNKIHYACGSGGRGHVEYALFAFTFLIAVALSLTAIRLSL